MIKGQRQCIEYKTKRQKTMNISINKFSKLKTTFILFSPVLVPFQWAGGPPLADEADKADMTPQCMPVIDPNFVRENFIEGCIIG
jgi:hypothetical protein